MQQKYIIFPRAEKNKEEEEEPQSKQRKIFNTTGHHENIKIYKTTTAEHFTNQVDTGSFFAFLFLYSLFNIAYWAHYSKA